MLVYAIDDEKYVLAELRDAIAEALPQAVIRSFSDASSALKALEADGEQPDIVFSDICMPGMGGLELAVAIKKRSPETYVIFVTGYSEYSLDAFKVHANGYLLKPVLPAHILEEIEYLRLPMGRSAEKICVQCFGDFEVFFDGKPLTFKRRKTKELLAYLIDHSGAACTAEEIIATLWEDETNMRNAKHNLRNLLGDLRRTLSAIGRENIIIRRSGLLAVDKDAVDCDYFRMLDGDVSAVNAFHGEYMKQYAWAQETEDKLYFRQGIG